MKVLVTLCAIIVFCSVQLHSNTAVVQSAAAPDLTFELSTERDSYLQLEPISVRYKLSNQTDVSIGRIGLLSAITGDIKFWVRADNREPRLVSVWTPGLDIIYAFKAIQPGEILRGADVLGERNVEDLFPQPGRYELRVEYTYYTDKDGENRERKTVFSNWKTLNILAPQGVDKQAYDDIKKTIQRQRFEKIEETISLLQSFVDNHRNSVYAKYYAVQLASYYKIERKHAEAERELCKIRNVDFIYSRDVERELQELAAILRPMPLIANLPEDAPLPPRPQPCAGKTSPQ